MVIEGIEGWGALLAVGAGVLGGAVGLARWVARDEVAKASEAADEENAATAKERQDMDRRLTTLEAQLDAKRNEDERRFAEFRDDLKELRDGIAELLRRVK